MSDTNESVKQQLREAVKTSEEFVKSMPEYERNLLFKKMALIDSGMIPIDKKTFIYIDLECIVDTFIGKILHHVTTITDDIEFYEKVSNMIIEISETDLYKKRFVDDVELLFPQLGFTNEQIEYSAKQVPYYQILLHSPISSGINIVKEFVTVLEPIFLEEQKEDKTSVYGIVINTYPSKNTLPESYKKLIGSIVSLHMKTEDVRFITTKDTNTYLSDKNIIKKYLGFFIRNIKTFLETPAIKEMFENPDSDLIELPFTNKYIFGYRTLYSKENFSLFENEEQMRIYFEVTLPTYMSIMTNFAYFNTVPFVTEN